MKVLVADDDPVTLRLVEATISKWGYEVVTARDGEEAWACLDCPDAPHLAVLDWMMPQRNGVDICEALREHSDRPYVYIILLTSRSRPEDFLDGMAAGADDYLTKPFEPTELQMRLRAGRRIVELQENLMGALAEREQAAWRLEEQNRAIEAQRNQLRSIIDNVPDLIYVKDSEGRFVIDNAAHLRMLGEIDPDDVVGRTIYDYLPREEAEAIDRDDRTVLATGLPVFDREEMLVSPEGRKRWLSTTKMPLWDSHGNATGIVCVSREVTEHKNLEAALRESNDRFSIVANDAPFLVWMSDLDGDIIYVNRRWQEFTGAATERALGSGWLEYIHPADREGFSHSYSRAAAHRQPFRRDFRLTGAGGGYWWFSDAGTPRYLPGGAFVGYVGACMKRP